MRSSQEGSTSLSFMVIMIVGALTFSLKIATDFMEKNRLLAKSSANISAFDHVFDEFFMLIQNRNACKDMLLEADRTKILFRTDSDYWKNINFRGYTVNFEIAQIVQDRPTYVYAEVSMFGNNSRLGQRKKTLQIYLLADPASGAYKECFGTTEAGKGTSYPQSICRLTRKMDYDPVANTCS